MLRLLLRDRFLQLVDHNDTLIEFAGQCLQDRVFGFQLEMELLAVVLLDWRRTSRPLLG